jgi:hypothetical protein
MPQNRTSEVEGDLTSTFARRRRSRPRTSGWRSEFDVVAQSQQLLSKSPMASARHDGPELAACRGRRQRRVDQPRIARDDLKAREHPSRTGKDRSPRTCVRRCTPQVRPAANGRRLPTRLEIQQALLSGWNADDADDDATSLPRHRSDQARWRTSMTAARIIHALAAASPHKARMREGARERVSTPMGVFGSGKMPYSLSNRSSTSMVLIGSPASNAVADLDVTLSFSVFNWAPSRWGSARCPSADSSSEHRARGPSAEWAR